MENKFAVYILFETEILLKFYNLLKIPFLR